VSRSSFAHDLTASQQDRQTLSRVIRALPVAAYATDRAGSVIDYNERAVHLWGQAPTVGAPADLFYGALVLCYPDRTPLPPEEYPLARLLQQGQCVDDQQLLIRYRDGGEAAVLVSASPIEDEMGRMIGALDCVKDITRRRKAEQDQAHLASIVNSLQDAIITTDLAGIITSWSPGGEQLFGYQAREMHGRHLCLLFPEERQHEFEAMRSEVRQGHHVSPHETRRLHKSGQLLDVSGRISPIFDRACQPVGLCAIFRDISEQKRIEREMQSGEQFRQLAESLEEIFWLVDPAAGQVLYISPAYQKVMGRPTPASPVSTEEAWLKIIHPEDRRRVERAFHWYALEGRYDEQYRIVRPDGETRWIHDYGWPLTDAEGRPYRVAGIAQDVTEQKHAQQQLRRRERELTHVGRLGLLSEMASGLGHELNQPLTAIATYAQGYLEQLNRGQTPDPEHMGEVIGRIAEQANRAGRIINNLRDFVRKGEPDRSEISINELIHELVELTRSDLQSADVELVLALDENLPTLWADRTEIGQVLLNLIRNAMEAIVEHDSPTRRITVGTEPENQHVLMTVADTGPGLAQNQLDRIFDPFFTTKASGMGMGLNLCETIVRHHDGRLWARNNEEAGLSVFLRLPASEEALAQPEAS